MGIFVYRLYMLILLFVYIFSWKGLSFLLLVLMLFRLNLFLAHLIFDCEISASSSCLSTYQQPRLWQEVFANWDRGSD